MRRLGRKTTTVSMSSSIRHRSDYFVGLLKRDKGYRRYASTVERVLAQFDTAVEEWADYISFLGRLLKVDTKVLIDGDKPLTCARLSLSNPQASPTFPTRLMLRSGFHNV